MEYVTIQVIDIMTVNTRVITFLYDMTICLQF